MTAAIRSRGKVFRRLFPKALSGRSKTPPASRFRAVEILVDENCCKAAEAARGQRFLSNEVPPLPLPDCDAETCACRYELFADRRKGGRRDADRHGESALSLGRRKGRRASDPNA